MASHDLSAQRPRCRSLGGVRIISTGSYLPETIITNQHLQARMGCDPVWLVKQTGIRERRHARAEQATSDLCIHAARRCLDKADIDPSRVDLLLVSTVTSDMTFPATACLVQHALKLVGCPAFDMSAGCSGFVYGLVMAASAVAAGTSEYALVIAGDCLSRMINPEDIKTYPLLGDGAAAALIGRGRPDQGLMCYTIGADGSGAPLLHRKACGSRCPPSPEILAAGGQYLFMNGPAVFRWAVEILCDTTQDVLTHAGLTPGDVDLYIPHQANIRIIRAALDVLRVPREAVMINLDRYGNTAAASVAIALDEAVAQGRVRPGSRLVLSGFGAGLTWGTALWRW